MQDQDNDGSSSSQPEFDRETIKRAGLLLRNAQSVRNGSVPFWVPDVGPALSIYSPDFKVKVAEVCGTPTNSVPTRDVIAYLEVQAFRGPSSIRLVYAIAALAEDGIIQHLLVNLGWGAVVEVRADGTRTRVPNGSYGVVFIDPPEFEPLSIADQNLSSPFGDGSSCLQRLIADQVPPSVGSFTRREQTALVLSIWYSVFTACLAPGRPVFLLLGDPGGGKSTTQRVLARAFYGPKGNTGGGISHGRASKDFFAAATKKPFVLRDDVNRLSADDIDSVCQMSTGMVVEASILFETLALGHFEVLATFLLSAFAPEWLGRMDLMTRLITLEIAAPPVGDDTPTETQRMTAILRSRAELWGETLLVLPRALSAPRNGRVPIRFDDWYWVIRAVLGAYGLAGDFDSALAKLPSERVRVVCATNAQVRAIWAVAASNPWFGRNWWTSARLSDELARREGTLASDHEPHLAPGIARDPLKLGKLLHKVMTDYPGIISFDKRVREHANEYRMWPAGQPDPLAGE